MKNRYPQRLTGSQTTPHGRRCSGFSMVELLIAMAIFLVIGGAATSLFKQHTQLFANQQSQVALNYSLRNAITQLQIDASNAGDGFYLAQDTPGWPIGITVSNQPPWVSPAPHCWNAATFVYSAGCFDTLNIILIDRNTPAAHPSTSTGASVVTTSVDVYLTPQGPTSALILSQLAADYKLGDQILFVTMDGLTMTTAKLTADGAVSGAYVHLVHGATLANGSNTVTIPPNSPTSNDPFSISTSGDIAGLGWQFNSNDWVLKLAPINYSVDTTTDPNSPKLVRTRSATSTQPGTSDVIADQIIGFKVGVSLYDKGGTTDTDDSYSYTVSSLSDFTKVRAVRISLISRTPPGAANSLSNTFDSGPYKIEAASVVINPRSLSMKDQ